MRNLFWIISVLTLFACKNSDENKLVAEWKFSKLYSNRELILSDDKVEREKIIKRALKQMEAKFKLMNETEDGYREKLIKDMDLMLGVTFEFKDNNTVVVSNNADNKQSSTWKYSIKSELKELRIVEGEHTTKYRYKFKDQYLILADGVDEIYFKRLEE